MYFERKAEQQILESLNKKPVMIFGIRQCGKTMLMKRIAKNFENHIYVNFEANNDICEFFETCNLDPIEINNGLSALLNYEVTDETLIVFDEVQVCPRAITSLKYYQENQSKQKIMCSGSNIGSTIFREKHSFPVGKVEIINMYPLDFEEFLGAIGNENLISIINTSFEERKLNNALHKKLMDKYNEYLLVGGMPEAITSYQEQGLQGLKDYYNKLNLMYQSDITKYSNNNNSNKIYDLYKNINYFLAQENQKFQASYISKNSSIKDYMASLSWLEKNGIAIKANCVNSTNIPLISNAVLNNFKIYYFDTGFLTNISNYHSYATLANEDRIYLGILSENYAATVLNKKYDLYFYRKRTTEIDFMIQKDSEIIPIEIKSANNTKAKSLTSYCAQNNCKKAYIVSAKNYAIKDEVIEYIPLYALHLI